MRWIKLALGALLLSFAVLGAGVELDNAAKGQSKDRGVGIALIVVCLVGGVLLVRSGRRTRAAPPGGGSLSNVVLRAARSHRGRLTAAEVAADSAVSFDDAKTELERLREAGACTIEVGEGGLRVYYFAEFADAEAKRDIIR